MKAILVQNDHSLSWSEVPNPAIQPDEVLVEIHAAALNRADLMQRAGDYPPPPGCPEWMGLEIAGVITEMGEEAKANSNWKCGDKVCALLGGGGYAEYVAVRYDMLMPVPQNCTMVEAAAIPEAFATAYLNLFIEGGLKEGNTLLMHAGASGLASVVIPMAKALGMRVITTVRKSHQVDAIAHLGADRVVNTSEEDIAAVLKEELDAGHGVDLAIDATGIESTVNLCIKSDHLDGRVVLIGNLAPSINFPLQYVVTRQISLFGSCASAGEYPACLDLIASGQVEVDSMISKVAPLAEGDIWMNKLFKREDGLSKVVFLCGDQE